MNLFQTFFDALKINWKLKPMWKLTLLAYLPLSFLSTLILFPAIIAAVIFYQEAGSWGDNLVSIFFIALSLILLAITSLISIISLLLVQIGSSTMMHQYQTDPQDLIENKNISGTFLKRVFSGLLYYLAILRLPNLIIWILTVGTFVLLIITENILLIFIFVCLTLISMPVSMASTLLFYALLPIFIDDKISFTEKLKNSWAYLTAQPGTLILFSLIFYGFIFVISFVINIPTQLFSFVTYVGIILGILFLEVSTPLAILIFITVYAFIILSMVLFCGLMYLTMGAIQSGYTLLYIRLQNNSGKDQSESLTPAAEPNNLAG